MKVLLLNASPRNSGSVSQMIAAFSDALPAAAERKYIRLADYALRPCAGCMECRSSARVYPYGVRNPIPVERYRGTKRGNRPRRPRGV